MSITDIRRSAPKTLYRIGPVRDRPILTQGMEGPTLPVSACPLAWRAIARLGGNALYRLTRRDGAPFALADMDDLLHQYGTEITREARDDGLIAPRTAWRYWFVDEDEEWRYGLADTQEQALEELDEDANAPEGPDGRMLVEPEEGWQGTDRLVAQTQAPAACRDHALEVVAGLWLQKYGANIWDGVHWDERLDVAALSAPRAGLFYPTIRHLKVERIDWSEAPDTGE